MNQNPIRLNKNAIKWIKCEFHCIENAIQWRKMYLNWITMQFNSINTTCNISNKFSKLIKMRLI